MSAFTAQKGRFWGDDDEEETSSEEETEDEKIISDGLKTTTNIPSGMNRFAAYESDSDSSDDGNRVARSAKERVYESLTSVIKALSNQLKISNWVGTQEEYEKMQKIYDRNVNLLLKEVCLFLFYCCVLLNF